jgi:hypothetical protein
VVVEVEVEWRSGSRRSLGGEMLIEGERLALDDLRRKGLGGLVGRLYACTKLGLSAAVVDYSNLAGHKPDETSPRMTGVIHEVPLFLFLVDW